MLHKNNYLFKQLNTTGVILVPEFNIQLKNAKINQTMKKLNAIIMLLLVAGSAMAQTNWTIDKSHSRIGFAVPHYVVSDVEGNFKDFDATIVSKSDNFDGADVTFTAKTASVDTDDEKRDGHLKSADFFDAEKFPELSFKGKLVKAGNTYKLKGDLTMKGVTKPVEFNVNYGGTMDTGRGLKAGFKLTGEINRQDFGVVYGGKTPGGEAVIGDKVAISCKIEVNKKA
jgi:polyisoprenoid-binding protein YceI